MNADLERRLLQVAVAVACLVPLGAGGAGVVEGPAMLGDLGGAASADLDSHFRYLSGLLLGIGLAFAAAIRRIERRGELFLLLSGIVVIGGLARLLDLSAGELPGRAHQLALIMELGIVPLLFLWQRRVARLFTRVSGGEAAPGRG